MTDQSSPPTDSVATLRKLPPSAKLVAKTLEYEGDLTQSQLAAETLLPARTVRYALTHLEDEQLITSRISLVDARQRVYSLVKEPDQPENTPFTPVS
jgi:DNA-binding MarR family transcriptional regulator